MFPVIASLTSILAVLSTQAATEEDTGSMSAVMAPKEIVLPLIDADQGRRLFVAKGCFLCHAVNGIGGAAAPSLNAPENVGQLDLMSFVARMWAGASAMLELQSKELGYEIELSGNEIADLAAFAASSEAQRTFSMEEIPETMRDWIIEKPYWQGEGWPETFEQEYHENGLPLDYD
ncbi:MAG: c-type cytochrome [Geminicoccales bacterium]